MLMQHLSSVGITFWSMLTGIAGININPEKQVRDLVNYAAQKRIGVMLWYNSGGPNNDIPEEPRGRMSDRLVRRDEMKKIAVGV